MVRNFLGGIGGYLGFEKASLTIRHYTFAPTQTSPVREALCYKVNLSLQQYSDLQIPLGHPSDYQFPSRRTQKLEEFLTKFKSAIPMDHGREPFLVYFATLMNFLPVKDIERLVDLSKALRGIEPIHNAGWIDAAAPDVKSLLKNSALSLQVYTDGLGKPHDNLALTQNQARVLSIALILMGVASQRLDSQGRGGLPLPVLPKNAGLPEMRRAIQESRRVDIQLKCGE